MDDELEAVAAALQVADPDGARIAAVIRRTFDQVYDGQHTGRYSWAELNKTERTHIGSLFEINLRRALSDVIEDGVLLDFRIAGHEVDCKYSYKLGGWMLPPESFEQILLVCTANDANSEWALGLVRANAEYRRASENRDQKTGLNQAGRAAIRWLWWGADLPPNVLLQLNPEDQRAIFAKRSGQQRVNELFRRAQGRRIGRASIAAVAEQDDFMKRVRSNGGARTTLQQEGFLILGGDYSVHTAIARDLGLEIPLPGEMVSVRVAPARLDEPYFAVLDGAAWRVASSSDPTVVAPTLPSLASQ